MTHIIIQFFMSVAEVLITIFYYDKLFERKYNNIGKIIISVFGIMYIGKTFIPMGSTANLMVTALLCGALCIVLYDGNIIKRVLFWMVLIVIMMLAETIAFYFISLIFGQKYVEIEEKTPDSAGIITDFVIFILCFYITRIFKKHFYNNVPVRYWIAILLIPLFSFTVILMLDAFNFSTGNDHAIIGIIVLAGLLYCNITIFDFFDNYSTRIELEVTKQLLKNNDENYKLLEQNEAELRILKHDIYKYINIMKEIKNNNDKEQIENISNGIENIADSISSVIYTGNTALDSILNIEGRKAKTLGIKYFIKVNVKSNINIADVDLCAILLNAIDNAIEAEKTIKEKCIVIDVYADENQIEFIIENLSDFVNIKKNYIYTTKTDKRNHGYGLKSIKQTVKKYGGNINIEYKEGIFTAKIKLKNNEACRSR